MSSLQIEVIYPLPAAQILVAVTVAVGSTVEAAIQHSGILQRYPQIDLSNTKVGIFSKIVKLSDVLRDGDRIEIYRPLLIDPKTARRQRAKKKT